MKKSILGIILAFIMCITATNMPLVASATGYGDVCSTFGGFDTLGVAEAIAVHSTADVYFETTKQKSGAGCLKVVHTRQGAQWSARIPAPLAVGEKYTISLDFMSEIGEGDFRVVVKYPGGAFYQIPNNSNIKWSTEWQTYTATWTHTNRTWAGDHKESTYAYFEIHWNNGVAPNVHYIDNFSLTPHGNVEGMDYSSLQYKNGVLGDQDRIYTLKDREVTPVSVSDVANHWAKDYVNTLATYGYLTVSESNIYSPDTNISRAEFVKMAVMSIDAELVAYKGGLADVGGNNPYSTFIATALNLGIIDNAFISDGYFYPDRAITKEEAAVIASRVSLIKSSNAVSADAVFTDETSISNWALEDVKKAVVYGVVDANDDGSFGPSENVTKADAAYIIYRICELTTRFNIYVNPTTGDDANDGSFNAPLATVHAARDMARLYNDDMNNDINIRIKGEVVLDSTLELNNEDSGSNGYNIVYTSWDDEKATLSMGVDYKGFTSHDSSKNIYKVYVGKDKLVSQAYFNGIRGIRARTVAGFKNPETVGSIDAYISDDTWLLNLEHPTDVIMRFYAMWMDLQAAIGSVEATNDGRVKITPDQRAWIKQASSFSAEASVGYRVNERGRDHARFPAYLENAYEFLNQEGEWYMNIHDGYLYYIPRAGENIANMVVTIPEGQKLITGSGDVYANPIHHIQFKNLIFTETNWTEPIELRGLAVRQNNVSHFPHDGVERHYPAAIEFKKAWYIDFTDSKFERIGSAGVLLDSGSKHCDIIGNEFWDISAGAVIAGTVASKDDDGIPRGDTISYSEGFNISNNYIHDISIDYMSGAALTLGYVRNTEVAHNVITNIPYTGIHVSWGWDSRAKSGTYVKNINIHHNYIEEVMVDRIYDGGGIYTLGAQNLPITETYSHIYGNYIKSIRNLGPALYHDQGSSGWHDYENVYDNTDVQVVEANFRDSGYYWTPERFGYLEWANSVSGGGNSVDDYYTSVVSGSRNVENPIATNRVGDIYYVPDGNWPTAAQNIIANAGIESEYKDNFNLGGPKYFVTERRLYYIPEYTSHKLELKITDMAGTEYKLSDYNITYEVEDPSVVSVSNDLTVTPKKAGAQTDIILTANVGGRTQVKTVRIITTGWVSQLLTNPGQLYVSPGKTSKITTLFKDNNGKNYHVSRDYVTYTSSNPAVAKVSRDGVVTGVSAGTTTIRVQATYGKGIWGITTKTLDKYVTVYVGEKTNNYPFIYETFENETDIISKIANSEIAKVNGTSAIEFIPHGANGSFGSLFLMASNRYADVKFKLNKDSLTPGQKYRLSAKVKAGGDYSMPAVASCYFTGTKLDGEEASLPSLGQDITINPISWQDISVDLYWTGYDWTSSKFNTTKDITFTLRLLLGEDVLNTVSSPEILLDDVSLEPVVDNTVKEFKESNLLQGSSFETDEDVAKWSNSSNYTLDLIREASYDDSNCGLITVTSNAVVNLTQKEAVPIVSNRLYELSFWAKSNTGKNYSVYPNNGAQSGYNLDNYNVTFQNVITPEWGQVKIYFYADHKSVSALRASDNKMKMVNIMFIKSGAGYHTKLEVGDSIFIDDIKLVDKGLVANGDFEQEELNPGVYYRNYAYAQNLMGESTAPFWFEGDASGIAVTSDENGRRGNGAKVTITSGGAFLYQPVSIKNGKNYKISFYARGTEGDSVEIFLDRSGDLNSTHNEKHYFEVPNIEILKPAGENETLSENWKLFEFYYSTNFEPILENMGITGTSVTMNEKIAKAFYDNEWVYPRLPQMKININDNLPGTTYYIDDFKIEEVERYPYAENDAVSYRVADGKIAAGGTVKVDYNFISNSDKAQNPYVRILHSSDGTSWAGYGIEEVDTSNNEYGEIYIPSALIDRKVKFELMMMDSDGLIGETYTSETFNVVDSSEVGEEPAPEQGALPETIVAPTIDLAENTMTLNRNTATVNKMYVAYMGTEKPAETTSLTQLMKNAVSFYQVDAPADKSVYTLEETGYYTVLLSYVDGNRDADVSYTLQIRKHESDGSLIPSVDNEADNSRVVINFNGLESVVKVCYGYIGTENYEYTTYKDFVAKAIGRVTDSSVADGDIFKIAKVGYYRFIINYNNAEGKNVDVVYTVSNNADILPKIILDGSVATLTQNVDAPVNKVYVGYMGKEDPGEISSWAEYSAQKQSHYCVLSPANGETFLLKTQGYYTFVVNYALGSGSADAYYTVKIDQEAVSKTLPSVENADNPCIAVFDSNGYTVNKICYGYLGTEYTEYAGYSDYVAKASNRMVDTVLTDGDTFLMTNVGYYRFIVNYNDGSRNYDAVYTLNNTVNISPVVSLEGSLATLKYNSVAPVNKVYVGYMGETDPGDISDWTTYSASRVSQNCVVSPIDGANIILKNAGYHTFVVNYTVGSKDKDVYYSFKTDTPAPSDLGIPKVDANGLKSVVISANGSNGIAKVYYGSIGTTYTEYAGFEDFRKNSRDEILVSSVKDGDLINLSKTNCYYRFIVTYNKTNGKTTEVVYTAKVGIGGEVTIL